MINTIAPHWDGNQVWLLTAGGAIFCSLANCICSIFLRFYIALVLVLAALFLRPLGFEYRAKIDNQLGVLFGTGDYSQVVLYQH